MEDNVYKIVKNFELNQMNQKTKTNYLLIDMIFLLVIVSILQQFSFFNSYYSLIRNTKRMDPKHVASILKNFVSDPQIISEMSVTALQTSRRLTWEENAKNFFQIIEDILGAKL